jgi:cytoskeletal protein CcmA (bactofilin family)
MEKDEAIINSLVGSGAFFKGTIEMKGQLRIDGNYKGAVTTTSRVVIGAEGRAECNIRARSVVVGGILKGNIFADDKVEILEGGVVIGDIYAPKLVASQGVTLNGEFIVSGPEKIAKAARQAEGLGSRSQAEEAEGSWQR